MPLVHRAVIPVQVSNSKLTLSKIDSEFIAVNNGTLVNVLHQLASLVSHASDIFLSVSVLTGEVGTRIQSVKLRLDELEVKTELFDPKLVPVPEGTLELEDDGPIAYRIPQVSLDKELLLKKSRPKFLLKLYEAAGRHEPNIPERLPITGNFDTRKQEENGLADSSSTMENGATQRPASITALRDWKLDNFVDDKIGKLEKTKYSTAEELSGVMSKPFPCQVVSVDVTGSIFDRMKANRRSLVIHTKRIRLKKKRRNTICGSMPNKECGIQTSFSSVTSPSDTNNKKYGVDSGHWSSCTSSARDQEGLCVGARSSSSAPSPWDRNSCSTSSDFLFDDEDRSLTPQLESFTDGMVSDSDSVDTEGYFTSFRNECGFPKSKKNTKEIDDKSLSLVTTENEYELFGKGSTSTTASSCGTVVLRNKPDPPARTTSAEHLMEKKSQTEDAGLEERVKRKSLIERVPSIVVVTPSPSCSSVSPSPIIEPGHESQGADLFTRKAGDEGIQDSQNVAGTLSDTDSDNRLEDYKDGSCSELMSVSSSSSTLSTTSSQNSTQTLTNCPTSLPQPDVIADVQQLVIRTKVTPKLDIGQQYFSLDTVLLDSSEEERHHESGASKMSMESTTSGKIRGARVVLDANGEIIFSSETLRRKRRHKISFDPGNAVKPQGYENGCTYSRIRESVYDRIQKDSTNNDKLYECIEEIRRHNLEESDAMLRERSGYDDQEHQKFRRTTHGNRILENQIGVRTEVLPSTNPTPNVLLETDLDSAIPPVMPELKTLPKIKDRLKRNESYRIATDEVRPRTPQPLLPLYNKKLGLNGHGKKRDIPEEDPVFIQQVFSYGTAKNLERSSTGDPFNRSITLSKLALSPDDRPSFLRRESPPTMDEITKEIYRFRKKFNIQPNSLSTKLCSAGMFPDSVPSIQISTICGSRETYYQPQHQELRIASAVPKPPVRKYFQQSPITQPIFTSTPVREISTYSSTKICRPVPTDIYFSINNYPKAPIVPAVPATSISSYYSATRLFSALKPTGGSSLSPHPPKSVSFSIPKDSSPKSRVSSFHSARTSLSDFKKLLQATKSNCNRSSISAVEILKPRVVGQETTL